MGSQGTTTTKQMLGELLVEEGILTKHRLDQALAEHKKTGQRLGEVLMTRGWLSPIQLYDVLAYQMGLDSLDLKAKPPKPVYARLISQSVAKRLRALPVSDYGHQLVVAMADPLDMRAIDDLQTITGRSVRPMLANPEQLEDAISSVFEKNEDVPEGLQKLAKTDDEDDEDTDPHASDGEFAVWEDFRDLTTTGQLEDASTIEFVDEMILQAIARRASDIHLEPTPEHLRIRYRVDGVLAEIATAPMKMMAGIVSRVKVMAELDITNRRVPQDGRLAVLTHDEREVALRVVTIPTVHGESVVLRILDSGTEVPKLSDVGMLPQAAEAFDDSIRASSGGILITGPTGSGKSTTLYAALSELNKPETAIVTVEDPVEYQLPGIKQIQISNKRGMTFPKALKAILRSDPDIVLVGEIRDAETAKLAAEAALTGHLVLSTLHTNSAAATPVRLLEMGVEPFLVTASVTCVVAQRLARTLCSCKTPLDPSPEALQHSGWPSDWSLDDKTFAAANGCKRCDGSGYKGRFAIHEVMPISDALNRLILERGSVAQLQAKAVEEGMLTLRRDGLAKAAMGLTTLEEVERVTPAR